MGVVVGGNCQKNQRYQKYFPLPLQFFLPIAFLPFLASSESDTNACDAEIYIMLHVSSRLRSPHTMDLTAFTEQHVHDYGIVGGIYEPLYHGIWQPLDLQQHFIFFTHDNSHSHRAATEQYGTLTVFYVAVMEPSRAVG